MKALITHFKTNGITATMKHMIVEHSKLLQKLFKEVISTPKDPQVQ
jgi:hypothetical protein